MRCSWVVVWKCGGRNWIFLNLNIRPTWVKRRLVLDSEKLVQILVPTLTTYMYWFPLVAVTNYCKFHGLNNKNVLSHCSGGQNSETSTTAVTLPLEALEEHPSLPSPALGGSRLSLSCGCLCSHMLFSVFVFSLLPLIRTPVIGFRAHPGNPR